MSSVIVLNKAWTPIDIIDVFDAVTKMYQSKAWALDASFKMHNWESWVSSWEDAKILSKDIIRTPNINVPIPRVIVLKDYKGFVAKNPKCNRRNLYLRDESTCQYCGKHGEYKDFEIEHIVPQSRGGRTEWTNVVLSCTKCNQKKSNRTPEEAGMKLIKKPFKPKWSEIKEKTCNKIKFNSWHDLLSELYWTAELEE